jgi:hypothetical protein
MRASAVRRLLKEWNPFGWLWVPGSEQPIEQVKCFGDSQGAGPTAPSYERFEMTGHHWSGSYSTGFGFEERNANVAFNPIRLGFVL